MGRNPNGCTPAMVAESLRISAQTAGTYLGRLADSQRIFRMSRGVYVPALPTPVETVDLWNEEPPDSQHLNTFNTPREGQGGAS